jgi:putative membrane protein
MAGISLGIEAWAWMGAWALLMALVVLFLVREPRHARHDDPAEILRDRFARGEISEEEFRRAVAALDDDTPPAAAARHHARHGQEARHD